ncbi:hypothetical protein [Paraflavitalea speifideaquila]|nr:hypothetical protein [Paraflavitalea speifideiaquila]
MERSSVKGYDRRQQYPPLNCWVRVTNSRNKKSVILRITDRMHPKNPG